MRDGFDQGEAPLVEAQPVAPDVRADLIGRLGAKPERLDVDVETGGVVRRDLGSPRGRVLDQTLVAGIHPDRVELLDPLEGGEVAPERVRLGVLPAADVRRDVVEEDVAAEEATRSLAEQGDVPVGVARQEEHEEPLVRDLDSVALGDQAGRLRGVDRDATLVVGRPGGLGLGHAVSAQIRSEGAVVGAKPGSLREFPVGCALDDLGGVRELLERAARTDVVGVVVGDDDAADSRRPQLCECFRPAAGRSRRSEAAVDDRPPVGILERVAVDVVERPGKRERDAVDPAAERRDDRLWHAEDATRADSPPYSASSIRRAAKTPATAPATLPKSAASEKDPCPKSPGRRPPMIDPTRTQSVVSDLGIGHLSAADTLRLSGYARASRPTKAAFSEPERKGSSLISTPG